MEQFACEIFDCDQRGAIIINQGEEASHYFCWDHFDTWSQRDRSAVAEAAEEPEKEEPAG
jgi:hypothetical protein